MLRASKRQSSTLSDEARPLLSVVSLLMDHLRTHVRCVDAEVEEDGAAAPVLGLEAGALVETLEAGRHVDALSGQPLGGGAPPLTCWEAAAWTRRGHRMLVQLMPPDLKAAGVETLELAAVRPVPVGVDRVRIALQARPPACALFLILYFEGPNTRRRFMDALDQGAEAATEGRASPEAA